MRMKMKRVFRRNQIIITTLAIMIAAAGYLNYAGKSDLPGADTYEAGATKISDSDIYSENQAVSGSVADGEYEEIASLDDPGEEIRWQQAVRRAQRRGRRTERRHLRTIRQSITRARRF